LQAFEASCFEGREVPEKRKKDQFRKLVSGIVGVRIIRDYFYILFPLG